ncbi:MAG: hypothetical protein Q4G10_02905 [Bacteroidia bacterium]|nr:hypothetical protein [Bacteroidia bacterium]
MKQLLLILSFLFSSLFSGGKGYYAENAEVVPSAVIEAAAQDSPDRNPNYDTPALLPVQTAQYSGGNSHVAPSFRSTNSGKRTQTSQKSSFRIVKDGKVLDKNHYFVFQAELHQFQSGIHSTSRYIHAICHLLI